MLFRVAHGKHFDTDRSKEPDKDGMRPDRMYNQGDIVESDTDLVARFGPKYERVDGPQQPRGSPQLSDDEMRARIAEYQAHLDRNKDDYESLSDDELRLYCDEEELEYPENANRAQLLAAARASKE